MRRRFTIPLVLAVLFPAASLPAAPPAFLPTPPRQAAPWTPPTGKDAAGFPPALLSATETLFAQGLADPRGGAYQAITVQVGNVWNGGGGTVETRGWVFPGEAGGRRFAACWNGLVYPVVAVKGGADLRADVRKLVDALAEERRKRQGPDGYFALYWNPALPEGASLAPGQMFLLKVAYLLRLGENDLARTLYDLWEAGTPPQRSSNREVLRDPYLHLAWQWAWSAYNRAVCAHMRGADRLAADDAELLTRIRPGIEAEAAKRGYRTFPGGVHATGQPYLPFLDNLPALRRDSLRRVAEAPRPPLDVNALQKLPQSARIAALIRRLDEIDARQSGQPGGVGLDDHPIPEALIAEGNAAIEPLLDVLEKDERLTRSVSFHRDFFPERELLTVREAASACFARVAGVTAWGTSVAALRAWWAKNKDASVAERWFAQLADNGGIFWSEAAARIVERADVQRRGLWVTMPRHEPGKPLPPFKGESLRARRNPSVSELLRKRALQLSEPTKESGGVDCAGAATLALMLTEWEPNGRDTLPTLQEVMRRCVEFQTRQPRDSGSYDRFQLGGRIARLTVARLRRGDTDAAAEYAAWLQTVSPEYLSFETERALATFVLEPENPALLRVADTLFAEGGAAPSAWSRLLADPKSRDNPHASELLASDLLRQPAFRALVIRRLADTAEAGVLTHWGDDERTRQIAWSDGSLGGVGLPKDATLRRQVLRVRDRCALGLQRLDGVPRFDPLASVAERDRRCVAIAAYLDRYGPTFGRAEPPSGPLYGYRDRGSGLNYFGPTFPPRTRPATEADVRENRAIFTLGDANARVASDLPAPLPFEAEWDKDPEASFALRSGGKKVPSSRGLVWQAEEVYDGRKWVRYYGYVGPHSLAKVPADDLRITDYRAAQEAQQR